MCRLRHLGACIDHAKFLARTSSVLRLSRTPSYLSESSSTASLSLATSSRSSSVRTSSSGAFASASAATAVAIRPSKYLAEEGTASQVCDHVGATYGVEHPVAPLLSPLRSTPKQLSFLPSRADPPHWRGAGSNGKVQGVTRKHSKTSHLEKKTCTEDGASRGHRYSPTRRQPDPRDTNARLTRGTHTFAVPAAAWPPGPRTLSTPRPPSKSWRRPARRKLPGKPTHHVAGSPPRQSHVKRSIEQRSAVANDSTVALI